MAEYLLEPHAISRRSLRLGQQIALCVIEARPIVLLIYLLRFVAGYALALPPEEPAPQGVVRRRRRHGTGRRPDAVRGRRGGRRRYGHSGDPAGLRRRDVLLDGSGRCPGERLHRRVRGRPGGPPYLGRRTRDPAYG